jgi:hypothetical protein
MGSSVHGLLGVKVVGVGVGAVRFTHLSCAQPYALAMATG